MVNDSVENLPEVLRKLYFGDKERVCAFLQQKMGLRLKHGLVERSPCERPGVRNRNSRRSRQETKQGQTEIARFGLQSFLQSTVSTSLPPKHHLGLSCVLPKRSSSPNLRGRPLSHEQTFLYSIRKQRTRPFPLYMSRKACF
ncbi:hypothetical protein BD310DRAFT_462274 [Dichomitus squalens]|uniref:Uncharacterized protein n=1 Tax=Dichomitus squalens TaxID=114155 RepID=A0A4Q9QAE0_9APHY|nr:hypothetical protein BD310DRAFT_462274 [Dichomitus squalens]